MNENEAKILKSALPASTFCLEYLFHGFDDQPISWGKFIFRGEHLCLATQLDVEPKDQDP
jgi:hypothetical protein